MKKLIKLITLSITLVVISLSVVLSLNNKESKVSATDIDNPTLSVYKKNLSYSSEIYIMYAVSYSGFNPETYPVKMLFYDTIKTEYTKDNATYEVATSGKIVVSDVSCLVYASKGLSAKQMTEDIYARAYVEIDDQIIYSEVVKYSVLEYTYEAMGKVNEKITNLLLAMKEYGSCAQINFDYLLDRLANATYYNVNVVGGTLEDGFTQGRFNSTEEFTLVAPIKEGCEFVNWTNSQGVEVSTEAIYTTTTSKDETFTANYQEDNPVEILLASEEAYDVTASTLELPSTVSFEYKNETKEEAVTWDTSTFVANKIGKQKIYGTLNNNQYVVKEISIEVDVLPYTFYNESNNTYSIKKYYGTDTHLVIPSKFNYCDIIGIATCAFEHCKSLVNIEIPDSITFINAEAFSSCNNLANIAVDDNNSYYKSIDGNLYSKDGKTLKQYAIGKNDTDFEIPNGVMIIENEAFAHCENLINIIISNSVTNIGSSAFNYCYNLINIELPKSITNIGSAAFSSCSSLNNLYYDGTLDNWCNIVFFDETSNPIFYTEHFYLKNDLNEWTELTDITISNTITSVGKYQFSGFKNLKNLEISDSVINIGKYAFYHCENLTKVVIGKGVASIGECAFSICKNLSNINVDDNNLYYKSIDGNLYTKDDKILIQYAIGKSNTNFEIPNNVEKILSSAFRNCYNLTNITFEEDSELKYVGEYAFNNCINLTSVNIPNTVISIGSSVFNNCSDLIIYCEATLKPSGWPSNWNCSRPVYWGVNKNTLVEIDDVQYVLDLENNTAKLTKYKGTSDFFEIPQIIIYNDIEYVVNIIGDESFKECSNLISVEIPNGVTSIEILAFFDCNNLISITIPNSLTIINDRAFYYCGKIKDVYYDGTEEEWDSIEVIGSYNYKLLNAEIHFKESIEIFEENGISYLYLGTYPQSLVDDSTIISNLNNISTTNNLGYIEYNGNEYKKVTAKQYQSNYTFTNGETITYGDTYYFKVEPIKWRILESNDGTYKLLSEMILDNAKFFHTSDSTRTINETTIYPNNYEYSNIRAWLNGYDGTSYNVDNYTNKGFIDIAFTDEEKALINETLVDNSLSSTGDSENRYICNNTTDKIYLLSYSEVTNTNYGFRSSTARKATVSDYARSKGCYMSTDSRYYGNGYWWLRSPSNLSDGNACVVNYYGDFYSHAVCSYSTDVNLCYHAVRAALEITIE